jgi:acyl carrier protein
MNENSANETDMEHSIAEVWREVLRRNEIGLGDNFFDLGGDSLLLAAVHSRLQKALNREIAITDLFAWPTVRELAQHLTDTGRGAGELSKAQQRAAQQRKAFHRWRERRPAADRG